MDAKWLLQNYGFPDLLDPSWNQLREVLSRLDGETYEIVMLTKIDSQQTLSAGGGNNGRYLVSYASPITFPHSYVATDLSLDGADDVELTIQEPDKFPSRWCIRLPLVLRIFEYFFYNSDIPKDIRWEIEDSFGELFGKVVEL